MACCFILKNNDNREENYNFGVFLCCSESLGMNHNYEIICVLGLNYS